MAEISCLQIHDPNDAVPHNHNRRRRRHSYHRRGEALTQILDYIPYWVHGDDFDLYVSDAEFPSAAVFAGDVLNSDSIASASERLDFIDRRSFVMDLFHQRVEQSQVTPYDDTNDDEVEELRSESEFGVIEGNCDVGMGSLDLGSDMGLESGGGFVVENIGDSDIDISVNFNPNDYDEDEHELMGFYLDGRPLRRESRDVASTRNDMRVLESGSDDDVDGLENENENENERDLWGIELNADDVYVNDESDVEDNVSVAIPLRWDSLQLEDCGVTNEDFEWEEVNGGVVDERETLSVFEEANADDNPASITLEDLAIGERTEVLENLGWEVLLNSHNLDTNPDLESNRDVYLGGDHDDYIHTTEYEMLFEQFAQTDISSVGPPPASKAFVRNLPLVVLTKEDVGNDEALCAVCKDQMNVGDEAAQLPCSHRYHSDCIRPWLGIRNTCPVCRFESPTDDSEYERRKSQRTTNSL